MDNFGPEFQKRLTIQSWSLYGVGMLAILLRMVASINRLGIRKLQLDDYLMVIEGLIFTLLTVCFNVTTDRGGSNLYPPELEGTFTPSEIQARITGSKLVVVSQQAMLSLVYLNKVCMLLMYTRLTLGLYTHRLVRILGVYVFLGWTSTQIAFFAACRPFSGYWHMSPSNRQCTTYEHYAIVQAVFNISSDIFILLIHIPLIARLQVPLVQKLVLSCLFSMGIFVVAAAVLTKYFKLTELYSSEYMLWYIREASIAVYVSNLPLIWPLALEVFPGLRKWAAGHSLPGGVAADARRHSGWTSMGGRRRRRMRRRAMTGERPNIGSIQPPTIPAMTLDLLRGGRSNSLVSLDSVEIADEAGKSTKGEDRNESSTCVETISGGIQVSSRTTVVREQATAKDSRDVDNGIFVISRTNEITSSGSNGV